MKFPAYCELSGPAAELHRLLEPVRSAITLSSLNALPQEQIPSVLNIDRRQLAAAMAKTAPRSFQKGNHAGLEIAEVDAAASKQISEAAKAFAAHRSGARIAVSNPAMIAVGLGFLLLVGVLAWHLLGQAGTFPDEAIKIAATGAKAGAEQFDAVEEEAGHLQDWFMLKGFDNFRVPPGLEHYHVVGVRLFKAENEYVAQAAVREHTTFFYSFPAHAFGIRVVPEKSWRITEDGRTVLAIRQEDGMCFLIAFRGRKQDMEALLEKAGR